MLNLQNIKEAKQRLGRYDPTSFTGVGDSFRLYTNRINVQTFRHINSLDISPNEMSELIDNAYEKFDLIFQLFYP